MDRKLPIQKREILTDAERRWANRLQRVLKDKPKTVELVMGYSCIDFHPVNTFHNHMIDFSVNGAGIRQTPLHTISTKAIIPYSEQH